MSLYPTAERRIRILETLIERRYETTGVLAAEFQVCRSTIKRDFQMLCIYHPLYSRSGKMRCRHQDVRRADRVHTQLRGNHPQEKNRNQMRNRYAGRDHLGRSDQ